LVTIFIINCSAHKWKIKPQALRLETQYIVLLIYIHTQVCVLACPINVLAFKSDDSLSSWFSSGSDYLLNICKNRNHEYLNNWKFQVTRRLPRRQTPCFTAFLNNFSCFLKERKQPNKTLMDVTSSCSTLLQA